MSDQRAKGRVKFWKSNHGWGFVVGSDGKEYFVHHTQVNGKGRKDLVDDQEVTFLPVKTDKGLAAHFVTAEN